MSVFKKTTADAAREAGILSGNNASKNVQNATNAAVKGMKYFQAKVSSPIIQNGAFDQGKGNLFEYIEAAKFNVDAASKGEIAAQPNLFMIRLDYKRKVISVNMMECND